MLKTITASALSLGTALGCCQAPAPSEPKPEATPCVVWAEVGDVPNVEPPCQLNLIYPSHAEAKAGCRGSGGHLGQLIDTCYDVDY